MESKGRTRSFADVFGEDIVTVNKSKSGTKEIKISKLVPFKNHPFRLYDGERLHNMVTSIKELGVILPIVVRQNGNEIYEILSGHNRVNAAKIAGLNTVPVIIKECLTEEEANLIVTETNLLQRSFTDLCHSERAVALATHYNAIKQQGKRNDLINEIERLLNLHVSRDEDTSSQIGTKLRSDEKIGERYSLSRNTVARYIRLNELIPELLTRLDNEEIVFTSAIQLSFIKKTEQLDIERIIFENSFRVDMVKANMLRSDSEAGTLSKDKVYEILSGELIKKKKSNIASTIKIKPKIISKFFKSEQKPNEIEAVIEKALELYFNSLEKSNTERG